MFSTLGWNNLPGTNALAYYEKGPSVMKLFTAVIGEFLYIVFVPGRPLEPSLKVQEPTIEGAPRKTK